MTNQKDANKRTQGASQNLPNTHFQDDSLTDHDVLKEQLQNKRLQDVIRRLQDENRRLCDDLHALRNRLPPTVDQDEPTGTSLKDSKWSFPGGLDPIAKRKARGLPGTFKEEQKGSWLGGSGPFSYIIMFFF
ncbi:hypothetical protein V8E54_009889 [Elaphomyces granulatus]